ncbi:hypothetical protein [Rhizohabitans arisaemae]|uniref:hypothetical protein n=1 Tax=Rhizohabitans arisaemae TaxID=2720610 RepID=UPI0024B03E8D|nr:hypothetical protein [Rhizohabitans arisaemae]
MGTSSTLVSWGNAWLSGHVGLDTAVDEIEALAGSHVTAENVPLRRALADFRVSGMTALRLSLPVAGDPLGLTGPPPFTVAAVDAGQAATAVFPNRCLGLVPAEDRRGSSYVGVSWTVFEASTTPPDVPSLAEAEYALTLAMRETTDSLLRTDTAPGWREEVTQALRRQGSTLPPGYPPRAHRVAALAERLASVLKLATQDHGLTSRQIAVRDEALRGLDRAVRRAHVAAVNSVLEPVP